VKIWTLALFLLFSSGTTINANGIVVEPRGEYAKISKNNKESFDLYEILAGAKPGDKKEAALKVQKNLGSQIPPTILELGNYYLSQGDFEKAALYHRLSMFRALIDVRASNDESLGDVIPTLYSWIQEATSKLNQGDQKTYINNIKTVTKRIIALDKETPRNYDIRWPSLHSIQAFINGPLNYPNEDGLKKIIEEERASYISTAKKEGIW